MKLQPLQQYKIRQVALITLLWVVTGLLLELHNAINYSPATGNYFFYPHFGNSMAAHLLITALGPFIGGIFFGSFIIFYLRPELKTSSYGRKLLIHSLIYIIALSFCILIVGLVGALTDKTNISFTGKLTAAVVNLRVLRLVFDWYFIVIITIFFLDVSEKYGQGVLKKTLLGKYHTASKETRVFMFLDLRSSTTIAERIGEEKYFEMLKHFFSVANDQVVNTHGEIYQYVGDEVIISWNEREGLKEANCLQCFTKIREAILARSDFFNSHYGTVPDFKAAIHSGSVATGEIGRVKKEIVYSGDVLNTTARMVALCNDYQAALIISAMLYEKLKDSQGYRFEYLDSPDLRGKTAKIDLYKVTENPIPHQ